MLLSQRSTRSNYCYVWTSGGLAYHLVTFGILEIVIGCNFSFVSWTRIRVTLQMAGRHHRLMFSACRNVLFLSLPKLESNN